MKIITVSEKEGNILEGKKKKVWINGKKFYFIEKKNVSPTHSKC